MERQPVMDTEMSLEGEKALERDGGRGCAAVWMHLTPPDCAQKWPGWTNLQFNKSGEINNCL